MMAKLLTLMNITNMDFYDWAFQTADTVLQGNTSMRICACIKDYSIIRKSYFLRFIYQFAFDIALIIFYVNIRIFCLKLRKIALERVAAIYTWFTYTKQIQIWTINDLNLHNLKNILFY